MRYSGLLQGSSPDPGDLRRHDRAGNALRRPPGERALALFLASDHPSRLPAGKLVAAAILTMTISLVPVRHLLALPATAGRQSAPRIQEQPRRSRPNRHVGGSDRAAISARRFDGLIVYRQQEHRGRDHHRRLRGLEGSSSRCIEAVSSERANDVLRLPQSDATRSSGLSSSCSAIYEPAESGHRRVPAGRLRRRHGRHRSCSAS